MATANEIEIRVTVDDRTRGVFRKIEQEARSSGNRIGKAFGDAIGGLGGAGGKAASGIFDALSSAASGLATAFSRMGTSAPGAIVAIQTIGAVAGPALVGVGALAAVIGGTLLTALTGAVGALGLFSSRAREAFTGLGDFVKTEMGKLAESSGLAQALVDVAGQLRQAFINLKPAISDLMAAAAPQMKVLAQGFIDLAQNAIPGFQAAIANSGPVIQGFATMLGDLGTGIGGFFEQMSLHAEGFRQTFIGLGAVFEQVLPALGNFIGLIADQMGPALQTVAPALTDMVNQLGPVLADAIAQVTPHLPAIIQAFTDIAAAVIAAIPTLTSLSATVLPPIAAGFRGLAEAINFVKPAFDLFITILTGAANQVQFFVDMARAAYQAMTGDIDGAMATISAAHQRTFGQEIPAAVQGGMNQMQGNINSGMNAAVGLVQTNVNQMVAQATNAQGRFSAAGSALANSFRNGWVAAANAAVAAVRRTVAQIAALLPGSPAKKGPFSGRGYTKLRGMRMVLDFAKGIRARARHSVGAALAMARRMAGMFGIDLFGGGGGGGFRPPVAKPAFTPYKGAGAPSPSMLAEHHARQKAAMRSSGRGGHGGRGFHFSGDLDSAMACAIMRLIREGKLRIA
jgi:hypothetical protein